MISQRSNPTEVTLMVPPKSPLFEFKKKTNPIKLEAALAQHPPPAAPVPPPPPAAPVSPPPPAAPVPPPVTTSAPFPPVNPWYHYPYSPMMFNPIRIPSHPPAANPP